ncbi:hypothetical protein HDU84_002253 [Entophlyctis sp. JEL0112]|nr:hypothetical protein HDU84_002253 [Entophlyctis sp. JEL0112]
MPNTHTHTHSHSHAQPQSHAHAHAHAHAHGGQRAGPSSNPVSPGTHAAATAATSAAAAAAAFGKQVHLAAAAGLLSADSVRRHSRTTATNYLAAASMSPSIPNASLAGAMNPPVAPSQSSATSPSSTFSGAQSQKALETALAALSKRKKAITRSNPSRFASLTKEERKIKARLAAIDDNSKSNSSSHNFVFASQGARPQVTTATLAKYGFNVGLRRSACRTEPCHCFESRVRLDLPFFDNDPPSEWSCWLPNANPQQNIARLARLIRLSDTYRNHLLDDDVYAIDSDLQLIRSTVPEKPLTTTAPTTPTPAATTAAASKVYTAEGAISSHVASKIIPLTGEDDVADSFKTISILGDSSFNGSAITIVADDEGAPISACVDELDDGELEQQRVADAALVKCALSADSLFYWSFCLQKMVDADDTWHCMDCVECRPNDWFHCPKCNTCKQISQSSTSSHHHHASSGGAATTASHHHHSLSHHSHAAAPILCEECEEADPSDVPLPQTKQSKKKRSSGEH